MKDEVRDRPEADVKAFRLVNQTAREALAQWLVENIGEENFNRAVKIKISKGKLVVTQQVVINGNVSVAWEAGKVNTHRRTYPIQDEPPVWPVPID